MRLVLPNRIAFEQAARGASSYAITNYYGRGPIAWAKRRRFQRALNLASRIPAQKVIDMGTGDGVLLPTLAQNYQRVVGLDTNEHYISQSQSLIRYLTLNNVELICSRDRTFDELRQQIGPDCQLMFLLETLEHVGSQPDIWGSKMSFLKDCFSLLQEDGRIIVTVPKMIGVVMLIKNLLQRSLKRGYDQMTFRQLVRSSLLKNTDELEPLWAGGHVGFNHLKLDTHLRNHFAIQYRSESWISVFYILGRRNEYLAN